MTDKPTRQGTETASFGTGARESHDSSAFYSRFVPPEISDGIFIDPAPVLLASVVAAVGLVAGRAIGSLLRSGRILLVEAAPGFLTLLDGPLLAVGLFWVTLALFA